MQKKAKNILFQTLKIAFSVGLIYWLVQSGKLNFKALSNLLQPEYLIPGFLLTAGNMYLTSERWRLLLQTQSHHLSSWKTFKLTMIGIFFNFAVPGGVGGDIVKAFYFTKDYPESKMTAATSVLMDRVLGLYSMIVMAFLAMIFDWEHVQANSSLHFLWVGILTLLLIASLSFSLVFSQKIYDHGSFKRGLEKLPLHEKTIRIYESIHLYGRNYKNLIGSISISLLAQSLSILFMILAGRASGLGAEMPWSTYFLVAPLGSMATAIPISPAGVGVGQAAFYFLFNLYIGYSTDLGPTVVTAYQVAQFLFGLLGAFFYLQRNEKAPLEVSPN
ncbi:MAG: lysylphosphatidylglycerol synthase transmembrane domain-containing protein [Pseudobdellovibrionaceae bacterium]